MKFFDGFLQVCLEESVGKFSQYRYNFQIRSGVYKLNYVKFFVAGGMRHEYGAARLLSDGVGLPAREFLLAGSLPAAGLAQLLLPTA